MKAWNANNFVVFELWTSFTTTQWNYRVMFSHQLCKTLCKLYMLDMMPVHQMPNATRDKAKTFCWKLFACTPWVDFTKFSKPYHQQDAEHVVHSCEVKWKLELYCWLDYQTSQLYLAGPFDARFSFCCGSKLSAKLSSFKLDNNRAVISRSNSKSSRVQTTN